MNFFRIALKISLDFCRSSNPVVVDCVPDYDSPHPVLFLACRASTQGQEIFVNSGPGYPDL
jgi:hypothetical protein